MRAILKQLVFEGGHSEVSTRGITRREKGNWLQEDAICGLKESIEDCCCSPNPEFLLILMLDEFLTKDILELLELQRDTVRECHKMRIFLTE